MQAVLKNILRLEYCHLILTVLSYVNELKIMLSVTDFVPKSKKHDLISGLPCCLVPRDKDDALGVIQYVD